VKIMCGVLALATASVATANKTTSIPKDEVTKYVVENLDVTTLPSGLRPKRAQKPGRPLRTLMRSTERPEANAGRDREQRSR
jgi:hypothetical protein